MKRVMLPTAIKPVDKNEEIKESTPVYSNKKEKTSFGGLGNIRLE